VSTICHLLSTICHLPRPRRQHSVVARNARAGTVDYRALAGLSRTMEEIERLNQEAERKKKAKAAEMALRSPVKKKSRFVDAKAFERK
jgi:hypothetical protein